MSSPPTAADRLHRLRKQCRDFREHLPAEHQAAFDTLLRTRADSSKPALRVRI